MPDSAASAADAGADAAADEIAGMIEEEGVSNIAVAPLIHRLLTESPGGYEPRSIFVCRIDPMSEWQSVRLLQLSLEAEETGGLVASAPSRAEIEAGLGTTLMAMLVRGRPVELLELRKRMAAIDDVVGVEAVAAPLGSAESEIVAAPLSVDVYNMNDPVPPLGAERTDDLHATQPPPSERRQADLGAEARGLPPTERMTVAGDRLKAAQQTIRIDVTRLDELMNLVGELVVHKTRLSQSAQLLAVRLGDDPLARQADEDSQQFARIAGQLQDQVTGLRMLPIETVFNRFPRVVRDIAVTPREGSAADHRGQGDRTRPVRARGGRRSPGPPGPQRAGPRPRGARGTPQAGKPIPGTVRLTARHADGRILITVEDDGRGMDPAALRKSVVEKGLMTRDQAEATSDSEMLRVIFAPGFSTAKVVTEVSGRGVGMDVVRNNIERLGGWVDVSSVPGQGTKVSLSLPLTLAIIGALLVKSGNRVCALPLTGVVETLRVEPSDAGACPRPQRVDAARPRHPDRAARMRAGRSAPAAQDQRARLREPRRGPLARGRDGAGGRRVRGPARDRAQVAQRGHGRAHRSRRRHGDGRRLGGSCRGHRGAARELGVQSGGSRRCDGVEGPGQEPPQGRVEQALPKPLQHIAKRPAARPGVSIALPASGLGTWLAQVAEQVNTGTPL